MSMMRVPVSRQGDSLPAELRVRDAFRRSPYFSRARLAAGQAGLTGIGQCTDNGDPCDPGDCSYDPASCGTGTAPSAGANPITLNLTDLQNLPPSNVTLTPLTPSITVSDSSGLTDAQLSSIQNLPSNVLAPIPPSIGYNVAPPSAATPPAPSGYQWAQLVNSSGQTLAKVLTLAQGGSVITLPNGEQLLYGSHTPPGNTGAGVGVGVGVNIFPLLLIAGGGILLLSLMEHK